MKLPKLRVFLDLVLISGLRFNESLKAYNLIIDLVKEERLKEYYNAEREVFEYFRFKQHFVRRTKKALISLIPRQLIERISEREKLARFQIDNWIRRTVSNRGLVMLENIGLLS